MNIHRLQITAGPQGTQTGTLMMSLFRAKFK